MDGTEQDFQEQGVGPEVLGVPRMGRGKPERSAASGGTESAVLMLLEVENMRLQRLVGELLMKNQKLREAYERAMAMVEDAGLTLAPSGGGDLD